MTLKGKTVLVTGAARRLGRAVAVAFARAGANLLIHYKTSRKEAESLVREIHTFGVSSRSYQADLADLKSIRKMTQKIRRDRHHVDILVNNAAIFYPTPFGRVSEKEWDAFLSINLKAPFFLAQELGPILSRRGGRIINIADWSASRPYKKFLPYCISKAGLITLTQGLAKILAHKVLVSAICPGPILPASYLEKSRQKKAVRKTLVRRWGTVDDFVKAVLFVAEHDFMTGSAVVVDGGATWVG